MRMKTAFIPLFLTFMLTGIIVIFYSAISVTGETGKSVAVIDPGHGGIDGGAIGSDGTPEKDINLNIGLFLKEELENMGWKVIMTRETDEGLYKDSDGSIRNKKVADLRNRKKLMDTSGAHVAVSIHLNSFPQDSSVNGPQVFYSESPADSRLLGEAVQKNLGGRRKAMEKTDVIILKDARVPSIIVECGFLSNSKELELLKTESYQQKLAREIGVGVKEFAQIR